MAELSKCCANCGMLARRTKSPSGQDEHYVSVLYEANHTNRNIGSMWTVHIPSKISADSDMACAADEHDLHSECLQASQVVFGNITGPAERNPFGLKIINQPRLCKRWSPYQPGFSPKEHLAMRFFEDWEKDRKDFERSLENQRTKDSRQAGRVNFWLAVAALCLAGAQVLTMGPDAMLYQWGATAWRSMTTPTPDTQHAPPQPESLGRP